MNEKDSSRRKRYCKPELRRVRITPEESLAVGCKTSSGAGPAQSTCDEFALCTSLGS